MTLSPLKTTPSLVEQVCARLAAELRSASPGADDRLPPERIMAERLGVSRTVLREATKRLELQGLIEIRHGSGIRMVDKLHKPLNGSLNLLLPDEKQRLIQLFEVRATLEPENARQAALRGSAADHRKLKACHERFITAATFEDKVQLDMEFHCLLAEASGNRIAALFVQSLSDLLQTSLSHGYRRASKETVVKDHGKILKAILERDPESAARAMRAHLVHARDDLGFNPKRPSRR